MGSSPSPNSPDINRNDEVENTEQVTVGDDDGTFGIDGANSNLSDYSIGDITVQSTLTLPWTGTNLFGGKNSFVALGKIGNVEIIGGVDGSQQSGLFETPGDSAWFVVGDTDGLTNQTWDLPAATLGTSSSELTDAGNAAVATTAPDYTTGTVDIGAVTVNTRQSDTATDVSGVDDINGTATSGFEGLGILSGVRADNTAGAAGDIITFTTAVVNMVEIDGDLAGNIGDILIRSNNSVGFRDDAEIGSIAGTNTDQAAGIVASGETGLIQLDPGLNSAGQATILGDVNAAADDAIGDLGDPGDNEIVVVIV